MRVPLLSSFQTEKILSDNDRGEILHLDLIQGGNQIPVPFLSLRRKKDGLGKYFPTELDKSTPEKQAE